MEKKLNVTIYASMFAALTFIATWIPKVPIPATGGYVHLGDAIILAASMLFGPGIGALTGAIGSSLADLAGGYALYILPTFIIKGLMGYIVGVFCFRYEKLKMKEYAGLILGALILVGGYYLAEIVLLKSFVVPLSSLGFNLIQYLSGAILGTILYRSLKNKIQ